MWRVGIALLLCAGTLRGQDARWTLISPKEKDPDVRADFHSWQSGSDGRVTIWIRTDYSATRTGKAMVDTGGFHGVEREFRYRYSISRMSIDCAGGRTLLLQDTDYSHDGTVVNRDDFESYYAEAGEHWITPVPESLAESIVRGVCKHLGKGAGNP